MSVDPHDIREIFDTELSDEALKVWIGIAEDVVDDLDSSEFLTTETRVIKLFACHLATAQDPRIASGSQGASSVNFEGRTGFDLDSSFYGQNLKKLAPELDNIDPAQSGAVFETIGSGEKGR